MMDAPDLYVDAWEGIRKSSASGRLAHAYIIVGSPRGEALHFTEAFLKLLFCQGAEKPCNTCRSCRQIDTHNHIDALWLEPRSKTRQIKAADIRALIQRMARTSYEGGWKAGIILAADCMNETSANILLKTLEEPPPKTIILLVTDSPQALLPTILSRCQKIALSANGERAEGSVWEKPLMDILKDLPPTGGLAAARLASRFKGLFDEIKAGIADAVTEDLDGSDEAMDESKRKDVLEARIRSLLKEVQTDVFRVMLDWQRDVLMLVSGVACEHLHFPDKEALLREQAALHTQASALNAAVTIEAMARRQERNIPDLQIFDEAFRKLAITAI